MKYSENKFVIIYYYYLFEINYFKLCVNSAHISARIPVVGG